MTCIKVYDKHCVYCNKLHFFFPHQPLPERRSNQVLTFTVSWREGCRNMRSLEQKRENMALTSGECQVTSFIGALSSLCLKTKREEVFLEDPTLQQPVSDGVFVTRCDSGSMGYILSRGLLAPPPPPTPPQWVSAVTLPLSSGSLSICSFIGKSLVTHR